MGPITLTASFPCKLGYSVDAVLQEVVRVVSQ
jgi:hypothetical protein